MKVLVTGAKGQLGRSIEDLCPQNFIYTDIEELDITDLQAVRALVAQEKIDAIVNCAGYTNVEAAEAVISSGVRHIIIRTSWLYSPYGKNFVKTMLELTSARPVVSVVFDQVGTPTFASDLAAAIIRILEAPVEGIYNYSNEGVCSWYDFAKAIAALSGHTACEIRPCHSGEFPSKVHRPAYSVLDKTLVKETFGLKIPYWTDSLKECLAKML